MITYTTENIFESCAKVLVNPINVVGVMGKGLAKEFKDQYPEMFKQYKQLCKSESLTIGKLWLYKTSDKWILNFPTKRHFSEPSKLEYIEIGLKKFMESYESKEINSIAFPQLGSGLGQLDWESEVKPLMEKFLNQIPIEIYIHIYDGTQSRDLTSDKTERISYQTELALEQPF